MKKKILWILSIILLVLLAIGLLLKHDLRQKRTVDGIDISHHNVVRDWNKVKVGFIYAKATTLTKVVLSMFLVSLKSLKVSIKLTRSVNFFVAIIIVFLVVSMSVYLKSMIFFTHFTSP